MSERSSAARRLTASICTVFFCLPLFAFGAVYLNGWLRTRSGDQYYFDFPYLGMASLFLTAALIAFGAVLYMALRDGSFVLLVVPLLLFLVGATFFPDLQPWPGYDHSYMSNFAFDLDEWSGGHHRYPTNDGELQEALRSKTRDDEFARSGGMRPPRESHYRYQGRAVPYQVVLESNASGPHGTAHDKRPGVVYYSVSSDFHECWVTMTVLWESPRLSGNLFVTSGSGVHKALRDGWSENVE